eukprot:409490-Pleurochrysis_carterae.AAC.1
MHRQRARLRSAPFIGATGGRFHVAELLEPARQQFAPARKKLRLHGVDDVLSGAARDHERTHDDVDRAPVGRHALDVGAE